MTTDLSIVNSALYLVGADEIETFEDPSREAAVASQLYSIAKQNFLQQATWNFSLAMTELAGTALATTSSEYEFGYTYEYTLPTDMLRLISKASPTNDYTISRNKLYTNDDEVHVLYQYDVGEAEFPGYATYALQMELCKLFAAALLQDDTQIQIWDSLAKQALSKAKIIDAQNEPPHAVDRTNFALVAVR